MTQEEVNTRFKEAMIEWVQDPNYVLYDESVQEFRKGLSQHIKNDLARDWQDELADKETTLPQLRHLARNILNLYMKHKKQANAIQARYHKDLAAIDRNMQAGGFHPEAEYFVTEMNYSHILNH